jgi:hypothetical protein
VGVDPTYIVSSVYDGAIIDAHTHPMLDPDESIVDVPHPPENYRSLVNGSQIARAAAITIARPNNLPRTRARNDRLLQLAEDSGGFFYPVCSVHPADDRAALDEIDRVAAAGAAWLKLHPNTQQFDVADPSVAAIVRRATEKGLPILFDAYSPWDANQPGKFVNLAMAVPDAKLILAHAHGPGFPQLLVYDIVGRYPRWQRNVWIDISVTGLMLAGSPFADQFISVSPSPSRPQSCTIMRKACSTVNNRQRKIKSKSLILNVPSLRVHPQAARQYGLMRADLR